ncbi:MAG: NfeD family protein [Chloroflexota bacterium]
MGFLEINPATINPDLIYIGFVFSLWIAVTAAYMPGTGVIEGVALLGFGGTIVALVQMPTNWFAVLLIVVGGSLFMIVPFIQQKHAPFALFGLVMQGIGGLALFSDGITVSPFILAISLVVPAAYHQFILMPMLRNMRDQPLTDRDTFLVGKEGRVTRKLNPVGTVYVNSEHWSAIAEDDETVLEVGDRVTVIGRENLRLIVEPLKRKRSPHTAEPVGTPNGGVPNGSDGLPEVSESTEGSETV